MRFPVCDGRILPVRNLKFILEIGIVQENLKTTYDEKLSVLYFLNGEKTEVYEKVWTLKPNETVELCISAQVCFSDESKRMEACCDRIKESFSFVDHAISNQKMEYQKLV